MQSSRIILAIGALILLFSVPARAENCWWDGRGMHCQPGWTWQERREWREHEWRERMHRRDYREREHERQNWGS